MSETGRTGVGCHVYCMSPPRCGTPRVVESVGPQIRGTAVGRDCPDWRSVGDWGFAQASSHQVPGERV
eukprot:4826852-Pyramimonas_sp.AAC.1